LKNKQISLSDSTEHKSAFAGSKNLHNVADVFLALDAGLLNVSD
jgi:hypothetical protein